MTKIVIFLFLFVAAFLAASQSKKVVGYLPAYRFGDYNSIAYCKLTHLNICFANPDANGNLKIGNFTTIVNKAKQQNPNIIVCISLGGGTLSTQQLQSWKNIVDIPANRPKFISEIVRFVELNKLDGVDFDLEWDAVTTGYSDFVIEMKDSLQKHNKILSAALPAIYRYPLITNKALAVFDFINIMAYDKTVPWSPNNPGQHSSYDFAVQAINYWKNQGINSEKLTLGVPFYGYNFDDQSNVFGFSYASMVSKNILNADVDQVGKAYYNGRPTIERKVELTAQNASGIMIWELAQDRFDEYSLLSVIHNKFNSLGFTTTGLCGNVVFADKIKQSQFHIYPNPANNKILIEGISNGEIVVSVFNLTGNKMNITQNKIFNKTELNVSGLKDGIYILNVESNGFNQKQKLIIKH
ncbi:MAG: glycosyl hydrolase family 18 protein [Draconibacterium sp.]|nr:glycosyl hydrolase family 18 protein [Draconibacterium sp.]